MDLHSSAPAFSPPQMYQEQRFFHTQNLQWFTPQGLVQLTPGTL